MTDPPKPEGVERGPSGTVRAAGCRPAFIKPLILQAINYSEEGLMTPYINGYYEAGYSFMWSIPA